MSKLKTEIHTNTAKSLGIYRAACLDGYWHDRALQDLQYVYLLGQIQATESIHASTRSNATRLRLKTLYRELHALDVELTLLEGFGDE